MPTSYSLSSAPRPASSTGKTKRVSAQLGRLIMAGSRGPRPAAEGSRRGVSEDGRGTAACSSNSRMSKAAAWMWYTRGIDDAAHASAAGAVVPTQKQPLAVNASSINNRTRKPAAAGAVCRQPSRFKQEANPRPAFNQAASMTSLLGAAQYNAEERPSARLVNHLYDESELSRLYELLDQTEIDKLHSKLSAQLAPCRPSAAISTPSPSMTSSSGRQIKPLTAALHKLFKIVYTTVHNSRTRNSAMEIGRPSFTGLSAAPGPRKLGSACGQHVIHHHHHHYHHHYRRSSLDSSARDESQYEPAPHLQEFVRRRRHSHQSCSQQAQGLNYTNMVEADRLDFDDSFCTEGSVCAHAGA